MPRATHVDNPHSLFRSKQLWHNQIREQEVPNMVRSKLGLQPIECSRIGDRHDRRIIDETINGLWKGIHFFGCLTDLLLRAEIELE